MGDPRNFERNHLFRDFFLVQISTYILKLNLVKLQFFSPNLRIVMDFFLSFCFLLLSLVIEMAFWNMT